MAPAGHILTAKLTKYICLILWSGYYINMKTIKLSNFVSPQSPSAWSTMYNETLHDKTGSFLAQQSANITQLSDWHINIIRKAFDNSPAKFYGYIITELKDVTRYEAELLLDQVFPETIGMD